MQNQLRLPEFIVLTALMISLVAMTTDIMLPGLDAIASDLGAADPTAAHLIISVLFAGFAMGQLLVGPLSDTYGRRPVIHASYLVFCLGTGLCLVSDGFAAMLAGRALQGLGMAGPRIVAVAIVRDGYEGRRMARIMSFVMAVFILVPAIAPAVGQGLIALSGWRAIFAFLLGMAGVTWAWFAVRQVETLPCEARRALTLRSIGGGVADFLRLPAAVGYTVSTGLIFGPFLAYLSLSQQIFQRSYDTGTAFVFWFGIAALAIGAASIVNSALVERLGMRFLSNVALAGVALGGAGFAAFAAGVHGLPPFGLFMLWLLGTFFCMGLLFGNLNALAMEPLGHMAGLGAAVVGALSTVIAIAIGTAISESHAGGVTALPAGFAVSACLCLLIGRSVDRLQRRGAARAG